MSSEAAQQRQVTVRRVTLAGMLANVGIAALKFVAGWIGHSQAVIADAVHSLSDVATDAGILFGAKYWTAPRDEDHPYGHRRIETLVTVALGFVLAGVGIMILYNAVIDIQVQHENQPRPVALIAALISIAGKEVLYQWTYRSGKRVRSSILQANAWHHRSDALSSIPAAASVLVAMVKPDWLFVDHLGAAVVSFFILQAAGKIMLTSFGQLVDTAPPETLRHAIMEKACAVEGVTSAHAMRTRYLGGDVAVDIHVLVHAQLTVREGHDIAREVEATLKNSFDEVEDVVVHIEPHDVEMDAQGLNESDPQQQDSTK